METLENNPPAEDFRDAEMTHKPDENGYFLYRFIVRTAICFVLIGVVYFGLMAVYPMSLMYLILALIIVTTLNYFVLHVRFKKEQYIIQKHKLIYKGGGIFSEFENELNVSNVTRVTMSLPFIEHMLYKTGSIKIESAGTMATEIYMRSIKNPEQMYEKMVALLKTNGFQLTRQNLVQEEQPHTLAVFFEVFYKFMGVVLFGVFVAADTMAEEEINFAELIAEYGTFMVYAVSIGLVGTLIYCTFNFLDLKKRLYKLFDDAIEYTEGFLNKVYCIIPMENLADSTVTQAFVSKLFHLYDVKLSCQGSTQEILFKNIANGEKMSNNIDELIVKIKSVYEQKEAEATATKPAMGEEAPVERKLDYDRTTTGEFRMKTLRVWVPVLMNFIFLLVLAIPFGLPIVVATAIFLIPLGIFALILNVIRISKNVYRIKPDTIEHTFDFLHRKSLEFSFDKITGILFKESLIDKWCTAMQVSFWSIGSSEFLSFRNIQKDEEVKQNLLAKKGIRAQGTLHELESSYNIFTMFLKNFYLTLFFLLPFIGINVMFFASTGLPILIGTGVLLALITIYKIFYYKQSQLTFYEDYIHFATGLLIKTDYYVLYNDVKDITTIKYPLTSKGTLQFNVAGEIAVKGQYGQVAYRKSNKFIMKYVKDIDVLDEMIDTIFYKRPVAQEVKQLMENPIDTSDTASHSSKQSFANNLVVLLLFLGPLNALLIWVMSSVDGGYNVPTIVAIVAPSLFICLLIFISVKAISYNIQSYRVLARSGIIFKKQISITFNKIDFINFSQGGLNKICGNGNITVNTVGSSKPELKISNIKDFRQFYEILQKNYK